MGTAIEGLFYQLVQKLLEGAATPGGMYPDERQDGFSFRSYGELLFVGGAAINPASLSAIKSIPLAAVIAIALKDCFICGGMR